MDKKYPSLSFRDRINIVKNEAEEIGQMTVDVTRKTAGLLDNYDAKIVEEINLKSEEIDLAVFDLERTCIKFMAVEKPVAGDLLFIEATIRVISHIKRIGYLASNIAESISKFEKVDLPKEVTDNMSFMADYVLVMLNKSIDAFLNQDLKRASELSDDDDKVDELFDTLLNQATKLMTEETTSNDKILSYVHIIFIARYLERIADRTVAIGSRTIFMVTLKRPNNQPHHEDEEPYN